MKQSNFRQRTISAAVGLAIVSQTPARVVVFDDPLSEVSEHDFKTVPLHATIASLAPKTGQAVVCSVNGIYISRAEWETLVRPGEAIVFQILPHGGTRVNCSGG